MNIKILRVGDPHVKPSNIEESDALLAFVAEMAIKHGVDRIELLGDLFHTHAIIRLEVLEFWKVWLKTLSDICEVVVLVGNHDQTGDYNSHSNALSIFQDRTNKNLVIVEYPQVCGPFGYVPYIHSADEFIITTDALVAQGAKVIVCHQTFNGSKYDNGMYAPDGIDPLKVASKLIISGHIHSRQVYETVAGQKMLYPGTARWDTLSDANQIKGIWLYNHDSDGKILSEEMLDTSHVCQPIISLTWAEGDEAPEIKPNSRTTVELVGSSEWISKQKVKLKGKVGIKSKITDKKEAQNRKAGTNLLDFINTLFSTSLSKEDMLGKAKEWGIV